MTRFVVLWVVSFAFLIILVWLMQREWNHKAREYQQTIKRQERQLRELQSEATFWRNSYEKVLAYREGVYRDWKAKKRGENMAARYLLDIEHHPDSRHDKRNTNQADAATEIINYGKRLR